MLGYMYPLILSVLKAFRFSEQTINRRTSIRAYFGAN